MRGLKEKLQRRALGNLPGTADGIFSLTYFCGAVYDEMAYEKAKFAVASTLLIQEMVFASFLSHGKFPQVEEVAEIAHRYAKEVEHSDTNLKRLEELFRKKNRSICYRFWR